MAEYHPIRSVNGCVASMETDPEVKDKQPVEEEKWKPSLQDNQWKSSLQDNLDVLSESQRGQFSSLVTEYEDIFAKDSSDLGKSGLLEHARHW